MKKWIIANVLMLTGCSTSSYIVLQSKVVSMTEKYREKPHDNATQPKKLGTINETYCMGEPTTTKHLKPVGLIDEVTLKAQVKNKASFIHDAKYTLKGKCIKLEGLAYR